LYLDSLTLFSHVEIGTDQVSTATAGRVTVVPKAYDLALWLIPRVNGFPRTQRFVLGDRIETAALDLLDLLVEAQFSREKRHLLHRANLVLVRLRHLVRLANDLHLLGARRYEHFSERVEEIGRMIGGWSRQQRARSAASAPEELREDVWSTL
jgi:hypothetical protein